MIFSGFVSLGRLAPWSHRVITLRTAFPAAMGMVHGIHSDTASRAAKSQPAHAARLAPGDIFLIRVANLPDGGAAFSQDPA
jgi:hypothetical protein